MSDFTDSLGNYILGTHLSLLNWSDFGGLQPFTNLTIGYTIGYKLSTVLDTKGDQNVDRT